jgi:hypothetical protein
LYVCELLFQLGGAALKMVEVRRGTEVGWGQNCHALFFGKAIFQLLDAHRQARVAFQGIGEVGLERGPGSRSLFRGFGDAGGTGKPGHGDVITACFSRSPASLHTP